MSRARSTGVLVVGLVFCRSHAASPSAATCRRFRRARSASTTCAGCRSTSTRWRSDVAAAARRQRAGPGRGERGQEVHGGKERFAFENDFQLKHLRRILNENWRRLPDQVATAEQDRDRGEVVREGRLEARHHRPGSRNGHRRRDLQPAVPRLPVRAAVRGAALSPAPGHVAFAAARGSESGRDDGGAADGATGRAGGGGDAER